MIDAILDAFDQIQRNLDVSVMILPGAVQGNHHEALSAFLEKRQPTYLGKWGVLQ